MKAGKLGILTLAMALAAPGAMGQTRLGSPQDAGLTVLIPNTVAFPVDTDNMSNWEGYASKLGDGTLLLVVNTFGEDGGERAGVVAVRPDGTIGEYAGFYGDNGEPFVNNMDEVRQDGNPPSIAGDKRPGSTKYLVANESTPYLYGEFNTDARYDNNNYLDHIFACQIFELTDNGPVPVTNAIDPLYGGQSGVDVGKIRKGGSIALSNGNFVVMGEDRTVDRFPMGSIIDGETGAIVKGPFNLGGDGVSYSAWEGFAAFDGGFAFRLSPPRNAEGGTAIFFYDNEGNELGVWDQIPNDDPDNLVFDLDNNPNGYTTSINSNNRGDHVRIRANIDGDKIYYAGYGIDDLLNTGYVYLTVIDANTRETVANIRVNELESDENGYDNFARAERVSLDVDGAGNVFVAWSDTANSGVLQVVGRLFDSDLNPATESFLVFQDSDLGDGEITGISTKHTDVAMSDSQILVSARSDTGVPVPPGGDELSPANTNLFTVLENPLGQLPVENWNLY